MDIKLTNEQKTHWFGSNRQCKPNLCRKCMSHYNFLHNKNVNGVESKTFDSKNLMNIKKKKI